MQRPETSSLRGWRFETFEERLALSAEPIPDVWIGPIVDQLAEPSSAFITPLATEGHGWTDVAAAREQFGLVGGRQTVAIIDSGIAYDHIALGGGIGKAYRVVGGWDFAENDADPYDDGPAGFHGTHVAGIVGASHSRYPGVAPGVDLVALRVFDDQGIANLSWVEQALQWVHQHRASFDNPITTVNLSLGSEWNSEFGSQWTTLDNELKQLADDGLFISVAAGNSFQTHKTAGLSYPAANVHVTPVASVDAAGNLSRYSQRDSRVLAAPGERIMSTLPDHFYGGDGVKNDWGATSGTSMAAPYVAAASVLAREALENLGHTNITQTTIYDLFRGTADTIHDAATNANYSRLNVQRALESLVGADDFGSTAAAATSIGQLTSSIQVGGVIGRTNDPDYFQFTAAATGKATLQLSGPQHLAAGWNHTAGGRVEGDKLLLDVVGGQNYVIGVAGGGVTIGKYAVDMRLEAVPKPEVDFRLTHLVTVSGASAVITGTDAADSFRWQAGPHPQIEVNGVHYALPGVTDVAFDGRGGRDSIVVVSGGGQSASLWPGRIEMAGAGTRTTATSVERIQLIGTKTDAVAFHDSAGNDAFTATAGDARIQGAGYENSAEGINSVLAVASEGFDQATLIGSAASETLVISAGTRTLYRGTSIQRTEGFEQVDFQAGGGRDSIEFYTASRTSRLVGRSNGGTLTDLDYLTQFTDVESLLAVVRSSHKLRTDLAALEFVFQRIGRK